MPLARSVAAMAEVSMDLMIDRSVGDHLTAFDKPEKPGAISSTRFPAPASRPPGGANRRPASS